MKTKSIVDGDHPSCQATVPVQDLAHSIKIRAAQIEPARWTTQLATAFFQFRRTVRAEPLRMPRPWPGFSLFRFASIAFSLPVPAHPRNIPVFAPAHKWKTLYLSTSSRRRDFFLHLFKIL